MPTVSRFDAGAFREMASHQLENPKDPFVWENKDTAAKLLLDLSRELWESTGRRIEISVVVPANDLDHKYTETTTYAAFVGDAAAGPELLSKLLGRLKLSGRACALRSKDVVVIVSDPHQIRITSTVFESHDVLAGSVHGVVVGHGGTVWADELVGSLLRREPRLFEAALDWQEAGIVPPFLTDVSEEFCVGGRWVDAGPCRSFWSLHHTLELIRDLGQFLAWSKYSPVLDRARILWPLRRDEDEASLGFLGPAVKALMRGALPLRTVAEAFVFCRSSLTAEASGLADRWYAADPKESENVLKEIALELLPTWKTGYDETDKEFEFH